LPSTRATPPVEVELPVVEGRQFADPQAAAVEELHDQAVAPGGERVEAAGLEQLLRAGQQRLHLLLGEKLRQPLLQPGQRHPGKGVPRQPPLR
jgi:cytochrome c peroxidase